MNNKWEDFFSFRTMITMSIIKYFYIILMILLVIGSLAALFQTNGVIIALLVLVVGNLLLRLIFEGIILMFSIHNILGSIEKKIE